MVDTNCWREEIHFPEVFGLFDQVKSFKLSRSIESGGAILNEMRGEEQKTDMKLGSRGGRGNGFIPFQDEYLSSVTDVNVRAAAIHKRNGSPLITQGKISFSQGHGKRIFSVESMLLLLCLTASLLLLPLILPPLPPPPFMLLLLLPICILGLLMFLAFMPSSNVRDATNYKYL